MQAFDRFPGWTLALTGALAAVCCSCASRPARTAQAVPMLSRFLAGMLPGEPVPGSLPAAAQPRQQGVWSIRPQARGCSPALIALISLATDNAGLRCGGFHTCLSTIVAGLQSAGISQGGAQLIRIDTVATSPARSSPPREHGLRLRFEEHVEDAAGESLTYTANILLLPHGDATTAAVLIATDVADSYECFDAANRAFAHFTEGLVG